MATPSQVELPIIDDFERVRGSLRLRLPSSREGSDRQPSPIVDLRDEPGRDPALEPVQLLEGEEYVFEFSLDEPFEKIRTDRPEVFNRDGHRGDRGRFRTGLSVGSLPINVKADDGPLGAVAFEVRSRKLDYLRDYRWMLRDIAGLMSELIMERFATTQQLFEVALEGDAQTLYQRFTFLKSLLQEEVLGSAMGQILGRPYHGWHTVTALHRPGERLRPSSLTARLIVGPGPRVPWPSAPAHLPEPSLPRRIAIREEHVTSDSVPNRFVKFALLRWRDVLHQILEALTRAPHETLPVKRGIAEVHFVVDELDAILGAELFREVGDLTQFPAGNQVLQKREGYRDVYRAYVQFEAAALLTWQPTDESYRAGQRDVATLYEFWVFLEIARIVSELCNKSFDLSSLLEVRPDGLGLGLRRGKQRVLAGIVHRLGRKLRVELWYNRTFSTLGRKAKSWTRPMRPDYSLRIAAATPDRSFFHEEVWLHFDAKYRVDVIDQLFGRRPYDSSEEQRELEAEERSERRRQVKRVDLLKMHAYRDAIRRSAGAYVVYPGDQQEELTEYHEVLPGLGAFSLRPQQYGAAAGGSALRMFIAEVLDHVASQQSQHERAVFWSRKSYERDEPVSAVGMASRFLTEPPADTKVLLGYVKNAAHLRWILAAGLYNLRADDRTGSVGVGSEELSVRYAFLYGRPLAKALLLGIHGQPRIFSASDLRDSGYPLPRGKLYYCLPVRALPDEKPIIQLSTSAVRSLIEASAPGHRVGAPLVVSWIELLKQHQTSRSNERWFSRSK